MLKLYAHDFLVMLNMIERAKVFLSPAYRRDDDLGRQQLRLALVHMKSHSSELPLSDSFLAQVDRLRHKADDPAKIWDEDSLSLLLTELEANLGSEMKSHVFLSVRPALRNIYDEPATWFGVTTADAFKQAGGHIRDCGHCFALEQWTASVFHSMSVLEYGLQYLYDRVGAKTKRPDWQNVLNDIQAKIKEKRNPAVGKVSQATKRRLDLYDEAVVQFRHFKDAWRNHVSHGRARYDEGQATEICDAVRSFMKHLASWKRKKKS